MGNSEPSQRPYVDRNDVNKIPEVPVSNSNREPTDIFCTICTGLFAAILFIISIALFKVENLRKMTYPLDGQGQACGYDLPDFPLLYYTSLTDPVKRLCLSSCPKAGDTVLACSPTKSLSCQENDNPKYEVKIYDTEVVHNRIGLFCMPTDQSQADKVKEMSQINSKSTFINFYDAFWMCFWFSAVLGIVYIALFHFFPKVMVRAILILGFITFIVTGFLVIFLPDGFLPLRIVLGIALILLAVMVGFTLFKASHRAQIVICAKLAECATQVVKGHWGLFAYIPIFTILLFGLIALVGFQILACWSSENLEFVPEVPFYRLGGFGSGLMTFLIFFEFYWGMSFLKEAFNFCVSGFAAHWYYLKEHNRGANEQQNKLGVLESFKLLIKYHWGSVVGGSLVLAFLYFFDLFFDFFFNDKDDEGKQIKKRGEHHQRNPPFDRTEDTDPRCSFAGCVSMYNLTRSEAMAYINIVPLPYCNASRYCEMLADDSGFYNRSQITNRLYRLCAHIVLMSIAVLVSAEARKIVDAKMDIAGVLVMFAISMFTITYFIGFYGDIAEGLLVSVFVEEKLSDPNGFITELSIPPQCVKDVYKYDYAQQTRRQPTFFEFLKGDEDTRRV